MSTSEADLTRAHRHSMRNWTYIKASTRCGCFHCLSMFDAREVVQWTDNGETALCPICGIDSVLSAPTDPIDERFLAVMHERWFTPVSTPAMTKQAS